MWSTGVGVLLLQRHGSILGQICRGLGGWRRGVLRLDKELFTRFFVAEPRADVAVETPHGCPTWAVGVKTQPPAPPIGAVCFGQGTLNSNLMRNNIDGGL